MPPQSRSVTWEDMSKVVAYGEFVRAIEWFKLKATPEEFESIRPQLLKIKDRLEKELNNGAMQQQEDT